MHFWLLCFLSLLELMSFPLLGAGTASLFSDSILSVQSVLFGFLAGTLTMTLRIIRELWFPVGGAYNVDGVLAVMVRGLEDETSARLSGLTFAIEGAGPGGPPPYDRRGGVPEGQGGASPYVRNLESTQAAATAAALIGPPAVELATTTVGAQSTATEAASRDLQFETEESKLHKRSATRRRLVSLFVVALGFVLWGVQVRTLL
jgi:hypothetical protein